MAVTVSSWRSFHIFTTKWIDTSFDNCVTIVQLDNKYHRTSLELPFGFWHLLKSYICEFCALTHWVVRCKMRQLISVTKQLLSDPLSYWCPIKAGEKLLGLQWTGHHHFHYCLFFVSFTLRFWLLTSKAYFYYNKLVTITSSHPTYSSPYLKWLPHPNSDIVHWSCICILPFFDNNASSPS